MHEHLKQHLKPVPEPALKPAPDTRKSKTKRELSVLELRENFLNFVVNEEKDIHEQIFRDYFYYKNPSSVVKQICESNQVKDDKIVNILMIHWLI